MRLCTSLGPMIESLAERFANLKSGPPPRAIALGPPAPITSILLVAWLAGPVKWVRPDFHPTRLNVLLLDPLLLSDLLAHLFPQWNRQSQQSASPSVASGDSFF